MSDAPKPRTSTDAQQDFNNLAFRCGHLQHDIFNKTKDLEVMNETKTIQKEYSDLKKAEDEAAKASASSETVTEVAS